MRAFWIKRRNKAKRYLAMRRRAISHHLQGGLKATVAATVLLLVAAGADLARADSTITIATVNNGDMVVMQRLSSEFEKQHPDIHLRWVVLEENVLRQRVTTDIATKAGQFDILTIGNYEVPIWAKQGWLVPMDDLPASYDVNDLLKPVRDGLTYEGKLYGLPFYGESAMTFYRTDLFAKAGLKMPDAPTYEQIRGFADKITDKPNQIYGMCLRGKPGWGENMAYVTSLVNAEGGQWFDMQWKPTIDTPAWHTAISFYDDILKADGPPGATRTASTRTWRCSPAGIAACGSTPLSRADCCTTRSSPPSPTRSASPRCRPAASRGRRLGYGVGIWRSPRHRSRRMPRAPS